MDRNRTHAGIGDGSVPERKPALWAAVDIDFERSAGRFCEVNITLDDGQNNDSTGYVSGSNPGSGNFSSLTANSIVWTDVFTLTGATEDVPVDMTSQLSGHAARGCQLYGDNQAWIASRRLIYIGFRRVSEPGARADIGGDDRGNGRAGTEATLAEVLTDNARARHWPISAYSGFASRVISVVRARITSIPSNNTA